MELMNLTLIFSIINIVLIMFILIIQARNFKVIKSPFTIGLLLFAFVFLIQNLLSTYYFVTMMKFYAKGLDIPAFINTILQTIAFSAFLYISNR
jgi:hypothetical protein